MHEMNIKVFWIGTAIFAAMLFCYIAFQLGYSKGQGDGYAEVEREIREGLHVAIKTRKPVILFGVQIEARMPADDMRSRKTVRIPSSTPMSMN